MDVTHNIQDTRRILKNLSPETQIGLVPTMGALHEGHAALIRQSVADNDYTAISIFVNPLQFGEHEDLDQYPKTLNADVKMADDLSVDLVFNPNAREILGERMLAFVDIDELQDNLCGASRPGHFRGVCTIVSKLFHIIQPHQAYFGEKDIQQLIIIQRMVQDLNFPVRIVPCPLVREPDGLAKSSRNRYLSPDERKQALVLSRAIGKVVQLYRSGERSAAVLVQEAENRIKTAPDAVIDYVQFVNGSMQDVEYVRDDTILALAVFVGETRLIDNHIMHRKFPVIPDILAKKNVEKLSMLTCYDYSFAGILDGLVDMILVGDSLGHVILGAESTKKVSMQDMLRHLSAVRKGAPNTFVVADLPFPVSQDTNEALTRARELVENGADAVKPEGNPQLVHELVQRDIPVMSHLGLLPQTAESFKVVGRTADEAELLIQQAQDIQHAGAFSVVLECVPAALARRITADLRIPTIGIGSGPDCDGQVLVLYDLLGLFPDFKAKFVRKYLNLQSLVREAVQSYTADVKNQRFPSEEESFK